MSNEILVGYDGSECGDVALDAALTIAGELGAKVVVAYGIYVSRLGGEVKDYAEALEERGREILAQAAAHAKEHGTEIESLLIKEEPAWALADLAKTRDSRVIVVGSRGESPLRGALVGSTPYKLLQISEKPVLVVPAPADA